MLINSGALLTRGLQATFLYEYAQLTQRPLLGRFAKAMPSTRRKENYAWIVNHAKMREYLAGEELIFDQLSGREYEIENKKYQAALRVLREDIKDDEFGKILGEIRNLTKIAARHDNAMILGAYLLGDQINGPDGVPLFSATHPDIGTAGVGAQTNIVAQSGTGIGDVHADLDAAISALMGMRGADGEPYTEDVRRIGVLAGPQLRSALKTAIGSEMIDNLSNVAFDDMVLDVHFTPRITGSSFFVVNQDDNTGPIILQQREATEFIAQDTDNGSDAAFLHEEYRYKVRKRGAAGLGNFQSVVKVQA